MAASAGWPLFFIGNGAFENNLGILLAGEVEPKGFVIHVGKEIVAFFPARLAGMAFSRLDFGVVFAIAATLFFVLVRAEGEDFDGLYTLVGDLKFDFMAGFFLVHGSRHVLAGEINPDHAILLLVNDGQLGVLFLKIK